MQVGIEIITKNKIPNNLTHIVSTEDALLNSLLCILKATTIQKYANTAIN